MKKIILALAILYPAAVLAQGTSTPAAPPSVGGKPLVVVGSKKSAEGKKEAAKPLSPAQKLQACQDIDDATKERLNCYDAIYSPQPKPKAAAAKSVTECRFHKEEDERLTCYNEVCGKNSTAAAIGRAAHAYQVLFQPGPPKKPNGDCCATRTGGLARTLATLRLR